MSKGAMERPGQRVIAGRPHQHCNRCQAISTQLHVCKEKLPPRGPTPTRRTRFNANVGFNDHDVAMHAWCRDQLDHMHKQIRVQDGDTALTKRHWCTQRGSSQSKAVADLVTKLRMATRFVTEFSSSSPVPSWHTCAASATAVNTTPVESTNIDTSMHAWTVVVCMSARRRVTGGCMACRVHHGSAGRSGHASCVHAGCSF